MQYTPSPSPLVLPCFFSLPPGARALSGEAGIAFVKSLGATFVTDYQKVDLFDALPANSVDVVYDNYGAEGTADKAMRALRPGGVYLLMPHGECFEKKTQGPPCLSAHPKPGVTQLNYVTGPDFGAHALQGTCNTRVYCSRRQDAFVSCRSIRERRTPLPRRRLSELQYFQVWERNCGNMTGVVLKAE